MIKNIHWLGHASFKISDGSTVIYIDPWKIAKPEKADIILITHDHFDHFSLEDIKQLQTEKTTIISNHKVISQCVGNKKELYPGRKVTVGEIEIEGVASYNIDKNFHPKSNENLGFIITINNVKIYYGGDTDLIPEMENFHMDIALLPISGTYVMNPNEAIEAVKKMKPKFAVPMHYGSIIGSNNDAEKFKKGLQGITEVVIKEIESNK